MMKKRTNRSVGRIILFSLLLLVILTTTACSNKEIVARVNDQVITKEELYQLLVDQYGSQVLDSLIADKIMDMEIQKQKVTVNEADIENEINKIIAEYGGEEEFNQVMETYGYSLTDVKKNIEMNLKVKKLLEQEVSITEEEMQSYFEENKEMFTEEENEEASYEENKDKVRDILVEQKLPAAYETWLQAKYNEYKIENMIE